MTTLAPSSGCDASPRQRDADQRWPRTSASFERWDTSETATVDLRAEYLVALGLKAA